MDGGKVLCRITPHLGRIVKVKTLAIFLDVNDYWYECLQDGLNVRMSLVKKWLMKNHDCDCPVKDFIIILKQPALCYVRIAEDIAKEFYPDEDVCEGGETRLLSSSHHSTTSIRSSLIEAIGERTDPCDQKSVLNCLADCPADWGIIGAELLGYQAVQKIKQDCECHEDMAAFMVDEWWEKTTSHQFSWPNLQRAVEQAYEQKYRHVLMDDEQSRETSAEHRRRYRKVVTDMNDLQLEFADLQVLVLEELRKHDYKCTRDKLKAARDIYEPHYAKHLRHALGSRKIKSIDTLFEKIRSCWNFLDIGLLRLLVKRFLYYSDSVRDRVRHYRAILRHFKRTTPIQLAVRALMRMNCHPEEPSRRYRQIIVRLNLDPHRHTLENLDYIRIHLCDKLRKLNLLQTSLMVFKNARFSCVLVTWLVRSDQVECFEKMFEICTAKGTFFADSVIRLVKSNEVESFKKMFEVCAENRTFFDDNFIMSAEINGHIYLTKEWALLEAAAIGNTNTVDRLLRGWQAIKHNINKTDEEGRTSLIRAAEQGHTGVVALLLEYKAVKIDYQMPGTLWTALFYAHYKGHVGVVKLLEEYGADGELVDKEGEVAKARSTIQKKIEEKKPGKSGVGDKIVSAVKKIFPVLKKKEKKSIHALCEMGDFEEVKKMVASKDVEVDVTDGYPRNWTPLMCACYGGHYDIVEFLLERGADIHVKSTRKDWTALHIAAARNHLRITNLLLKKGAYPNAIIDPENMYHTPLMYINNMDGPDYVAVARALLKHGADPNIANRTDYETPIFSAISVSNEAMVDLLLEYQADCNMQGPRGWSPLMEAARSSATICKMLIDHGSKTDLAMQAAGKIKGDTALHVACYYGKADAVSAIVAGGADPNKENEMGLTPLDIAANRKHVDAIHSLAESKRLDINHLHERTGLSALSMAASSGKMEVCKALLSHGAAPDIGGLNIMECVPRRHKNKLKSLIDECKMEEEKAEPDTSAEVVHLPYTMVMPSVAQVEGSHPAEGGRKLITHQEEVGEGVKDGIAEPEEPVASAEAKIPEASRQLEGEEETTLVEEDVDLRESSDLQAIPESVLDIPVLQVDSKEESFTDDKVSTTPDDKDIDSAVPDIETATADEPKKEDDDDDSLYGSDEDDSKPSAQDTVPTEPETPKKEDLIKKEIVKQWEKMTVKQRLKLMDQILENYNPLYADNTSKGIQQPQVPVTSQRILATGSYGQV